MFQRKMEKTAQNLRKSMPIITILGPRQSGKTTLAKMMAPQKPYVNFEQLDMRAKVIEDPRGFLKQYPEGAIFDEVQEVPEILSYLLPVVDQMGVNDLFILTGSHQAKVRDKVSQSLAGRTAILRLYPLSLQELELKERSIEEALLFGGYPRAQTLSFPLTNLFSSYYQTYVERDIASLSRIHNLNQFGLFVKLVAGRIGQLVNLESLGNDVGISASTVREWLSLLEASHIVFRFHPYHDNFGKRLIKSPKIYFTDTGLACYLLGIESPEQLARDPLRGSLFENLMILELMKSRYNQGLDPNLYFYRDRQGKEVDVLYQKGRELIPIEIKSSITFNTSFLDSLASFCALSQSKKRVLIYGGEGGLVNETTLLSWQNAADALQGQSAR